MRKFYRVLLGGLGIIWSCQTSRNIANDFPTVTDFSESSEEKKTFKLGIIEYVNNSDCTYVIVDEKTQKKFDPINFSSPEYLPFKKNNQLIYYKYRPLRMVNRCYNVQPIEIVDIKKRED